MDYSQSFYDIIKKRQKSLGLDKAAERQGKRMLSINPVADKNSLIELDIEELELIERREKLIQIAKSRVKKQTQANNLMKAAQAEQKRRHSTMIMDNPHIAANEEAILD